MSIDMKKACLYHYYNQPDGPFRNLSALPLPEAEQILGQLRDQKKGFASERQPGYMRRRHQLEAIARQQFIAAGGQPRRVWPHYFVLEACDWLLTWYDQPRYIRIPLTAFNPDCLSFSYGDLFPTFSPHLKDGRDYRGRVYPLGQIGDLIRRYGLPQQWNADGRKGPDRYVEVQVWQDIPLNSAISCVNDQDR